MASGKEVAGLLIALTFAAVLITPIADTVNGNSGSVEVTNESLTAEVGEYQELDGYDIDSDSETVYWLNSTSGDYEVITAGDDYELNESAGTIKFTESGVVDDGDDVKVSYTYQATSGTVSTILDLLPLFAGLVILGVMAAKVQQMM